MAFGTRVSFDPIRTLAFGSVVGTYVAVGGPFVNNARLVDLENTLNQPVFISFNGVDDHLFMSSESFTLLDLTTNSVRDDGLFLPIGTQVYVRAVSVLPTSGNLHASVLYAQGGK